MPIFPKRALVAIAATVFALALMFSFRTPEATNVGLRGGVQTVAPSDQGFGTQPTPRTQRPGTTPGPSSPSSPTATTNGSGTLTGTDIRTRFGDVQVQITVKNGKITDVTALQLPTHGRSGSISQAVEPMLHDEALQAQSAQIDVVSGATYTSEAYAQSLQSALDQVHS
jgi:uncharacterized protein with FMN-binding domain